MSPTYAMLPLPWHSLSASTSSHPEDRQKHRWSPCRPAHRPQSYQSQLFHRPSSPVYPGGSHLWGLPATSLSGSKFWSWSMYCGGITSPWNCQRGRQQQERFQGHGGQGVQMCVPFDVEIPGAATEPHSSGPAAPLGDFPGPLGGGLQRTGMAAERCPL